MRLSRLSPSLFLQSDNNKNRCGQNGSNIYPVSHFSYTVVILLLAGPLKLAFIVVEQRFTKGFDSISTFLIGNYTGRPPYPCRSRYMIGLGVPG